MTVPAEFVEADLKREVAALTALLGDTRVRYHHRQTQWASAQPLMEVDREIRDAVARPLSAELQVEVRSLMARLRALDPQ